MKGKYIYYIRIDPLRPTGIHKKILAQLKLFNEYGNECDIHYLETERNSKFRFFLQKLPIIGKKYNKWTYDESFASLDYLYIRRPSVFDSAFVNYLKNIKNLNPQIKIICELPTYPYDAEYMGKTGWLYRFIDRHHREKMQGLIDAFAVVAWNSPERRLWGIPVLPIFNGIDFQEVEKIEYKNGNTDCVNLLCVAYFSPWHGYEKFIESLRSYYDNKKSTEKNIYLHMVGTGPELDKYKAIVKEKSLDDKVLFYGEKNEGLDQIYRDCDIGVCSINSSSYGVFLSSQLKSREYLAKGMPIITCGDIDILQDHDFPFELIVDYHRNINYNRILEFFNNKILPCRNTVADEIRQFAKENCGWDSTMKNVLVFLGMKQE